MNLPAWLVIPAAWLGLALIAAFLWLLGRAINKDGRG